MLPQLASRSVDDVDGTYLRSAKQLSDVSTSRRAFGELKNLNQHPTTPRPKLIKSSLPSSQDTAPVFRVPSSQLKPLSRTGVTSDVPPIDFVNHDEDEESLSSLILDAPTLISESGMCTTSNPSWFHHLMDTVSFSEAEKEELDAELDDLFPDSGIDFDMESDCSDLTMWEELPEVDTCNRVDDFNSDAEELHEIFATMDKVVLTDESLLVSGTSMDKESVNSHRVATSQRTSDYAFHNVKDQSPMVARNGSCLTEATSPTSTTLGIDSGRVISPFVVHNDEDDSCSGSAFDFTE